MATTRRTTPLLAVLLTLVAALAAGLRRLLRAGMRPGPADGVRADDGVLLHVEEDGDPTAPLTVVFSHGFTAQLREFDLQRETLASRARVVLYDQRGHGRSGFGKAKNATFDQLGQDLAAVLDARVPTGPVVLAGHSMGGMTLMAYARQHPEVFGPRVVGVFLLATSAGDLVSTGAAGAAARLLRALHLLPVYLRLLRLWAPVLERFRKRGTRAGFFFYKRFLFGRDDAGDADLVRMVQELLEETPLTVTAAFYPSFLSHDEVEALPAMRPVPVTIVVGDSDRLTPVGHSRRMAAELPDAELVVVPGAGHSVNITRRQVVDDALLRLLDRASEYAAGQRRAG